MCRQETALEMLKAQKNKGGLTAGQIKLTEAQIADFKEQNEKHEKDMVKMEARMTNIEKKVDSLDKKVDAVDGKIDQVLQALANERASFATTLKSVIKIQYTGDSQINGLFFIPSRDGMSNTGTTEVGIFEGEDEEVIHSRKYPADKYPRGLMGLNVIDSSSKNYFIRFNPTNNRKYYQGVCLFRIIGNG